MELEGRTVLVTGASAGIGEAAAHAFAKNGARVIISARNQNKLESLKEALESQHNAQVLVLPMDVTKRDMVEMALIHLPDSWNKIDILINNAGLALGLEKIQDADMDDWDRMIDTNIKGLLYVSHFVFKGMIEHDNGHVINIGSMSGYSVYSGGVVYCATKHAVRAISDGMKMDLHDTSIRVTEIDPGMVDTEFSTVRFKGDKERADDLYKDFDALQAQDISDAIIYAVTAPQHVDVRQMLIMPTAQTAAGMVRKK